MARKKKLKIPPFVKFILIGILIVGIGFIAVHRTKYLFQNSDYFRIRSVVIDPSLPFIHKRNFRNLMGKNIFTLNLKIVERKLKFKYPQASQLRVTKRFPDQISIVAKQRFPVAQIQIGSQFVTIDKEGIILSIEKEKSKNLTRIIGAKLKNPRLVLGLPLRGPNLWMALKIIKYFEDDNSLAKYSIFQMDMANLSKIHFTLEDHLEIIMDRDKIARKIRVLGIVLSQGQLDLKHTKYIDLRFKEPVIGKK